MSALTQKNKLVPYAVVKICFLDFDVFEAHFLFCLPVLHYRTGMAGVPGTSSAIFSAAKDVGANVIMISQVDNDLLSLVYMIYLGSSSPQNIMQASSEHSVCFAVPEKEVAAVSSALHDRFHEALAAGRLSKVIIVSSLNSCSDKRVKDIDSMK